MQKITIGETQYMKLVNNEPYMMIIRQVARTGVLSEYALRKLLREGKLPVTYIGNRALINYGKLCEMLNDGLLAKKR